MRYLNYFEINLLEIIHILNMFNILIEMDIILL